MHYLSSLELAQAGDLVDFKIFYTPKKSDQASNWDLHIVVKTCSHTGQ